MGLVLYSFLVISWTIFSDKSTQIRPNEIKHIYHLHSILKKISFALSTEENKMCRLCRIFGQKMNSNPEIRVKCQYKVCSPIYLFDRFNNCVNILWIFENLRVFLIARFEKCTDKKIENSTKKICIGNEQKLICNCLQLIREILAHILNRFWYKVRRSNFADTR